MNAASVLFIAGLLTFLAVASVVLAGGTATIDGNVEQWLHLRVSPRFTEVLAAVSFLGAPTTLATIAVLGGVLLALRRRYAESAALAIIVLGCSAFNIGLKHLFQRGRPVFDDPILTLPTYSFPSGHAAVSTVFYGLLAIYVLEQDRRRAVTWAAIGVATTMVALICFSRVYLGLHYLSDVLGGAAEGIAWLAACWAVWHTATPRLGSGDR